jgi:hypothetical protein
MYSMIVWIVLSLPPGHREVHTVNETHGRTLAAGLKVEHQV